MNIDEIIKEQQAMKKSFPSPIIRAAWDIFGLCRPTGYVSALWSALFRDGTLPLDNPSCTPEPIP